MGVSGGPYIVRDSSLVLELDAADRNSYVSGSTVWRDLSEYLNNITLSGGPTFVDEKKGVIQFDGLDDVGTISYRASLSVPNYHTLEVWMYTIGEGVNSSGVGAVIRAGQGADEQYSLFIQPGPGGWYSQWVSGSVFTGAGEVGYAPSQRWNHMVLIRNESNMIFYHDGEQKYSQTVDITTRATFGTLSIGRTTANTFQRFYGNIGNLRIYNRVLNAQEVLQNYNALRYRFNL